MNSGAGGEMLLEDAEDLADWQSRPPIIREDGSAVQRPIVPQLAEWDDELRERIESESISTSIENLFRD